MRPIFDALRSYLKDSLRIQHKIHISILTHVGQDATMFQMMHKEEP